MIIKPQKNFQMEFLSTGTDIAIGRAAAGVGKTYALLLQAVRNTNNSRYGGTIFRKTYPQITASGGLWFETMGLYPLVGGVPNITNRKWTFPTGSSVDFRFIDTETATINYQGAAIPFVGFDELTQFSEYAFWFLVSRNRSKCGVKPYVRATCNPDPDSFVSKLISWWIDDDGFPIAERTGVFRYFIRINDSFVWGMTKAEVKRKAKDFFAACDEKNTGITADNRIKSLTFIPGSIYDNKELLSVNPEYLGNLESQSEEMKLRFLHGNWKVKLDGNMLANFDAINAMFDVNRGDTSGQKYITCDASGHGRDFTVIYVWVGFTVVEIAILRITDGADIFNCIEKLRMKYNIVRNHVIVDADGVGNPTVKRGNYVGFHGGAAAKYNPEAKKKEAYKNFKTQCYYILCEKINNHDIVFRLTGDNCTIDGVVTQNMKVKGELRNVKDLIIDDIKAIRKGKYDDGKLTINSKDEQKVILGDRSPDFGDTAMMRIGFMFLKPVW